MQREDDGDTGCRRRRLNRFFTLIDDFVAVRIDEDEPPAVPLFDLGRSATARCAGFTKHDAAAALDTFRTRQVNGGDEVFRGASDAIVLDHAPEARCGERGEYSQDRHDDHQLDGSESGAVPDRCRAVGVERRRGSHKARMLRAVTPKEEAQMPRRSP